MDQLRSLGNDNINLAVNSSKLQAGITHFPTYYSFNNSTKSIKHYDYRFKVDNLILSQFTNDIIDSKLINITLVEIDANREVWWVDSNH